MASGFSHRFLKRCRTGKVRFFIGYRISSDIQRQTRQLCNRKSCVKSSMDHNVVRLRKGTCQGFKEADLMLKMAEKVEDRNLAFLTMYIGLFGPEIAVNIGRPTRQTIIWDGASISCKEHVPERNMAGPTKFLTMCLDYIQHDLQKYGNLSADCCLPFFANLWGFDFWNCHNSGVDVLEFTSDDSITEKIAWVLSTAAETISTKEKQGVSLNSPFLLYLVPSRDKVEKVHQICKPLELAGIETLILHSGASLDHHIHSIKEIEPEFLVSTPERLLELLQVEAVDISQIFLMVVDGTEAPFNKSFFRATEEIRRSIHRCHQTVVFSLE